MKILIWLGCALVYGIVQTVARSQGVVLGGLPTALLAFVAIAAAFSLCKLWDKRKSVAIPKDSEKPEERWYTCSKCGSLVREGEPCDCEAIQKAETAPEDAPEPTAKKPDVTPRRRYLVAGLSALCVALALCSCILGYKVYVVSEMAEKLASENRILDATLSDLSDENKGLTEKISTMQEAKEPSFSSYAEWKSLHDGGYITLSYDEWLVLLG